MKQIIRIAAAITVTAILASRRALPATPVRLRTTPGCRRSPLGQRALVRVPSPAA